VFGLVYPHTAVFFAPAEVCLFGNFNLTTDFCYLKTVCVVSGPAGCGKTTYVLNYFKDKNPFYFSFAGLGEELAEKLFADAVSSKCGVTVSGLVESIRALADKFKFVLLDDLASLATYKRFKEAFYDNMFPDIHTRPFVLLITQPTEDVSGLADHYSKISLDYFSIPEVMKLYPKLSKIDILGLCALSGGIPAILNEYFPEFDFDGNVRKWLKPSSVFVTLMPELMLKHFRRHENYHHILCAIANGNFRVGQISKFTGFTHNKSDNYLARLIDNGFVTADKVITKSGIEKTVYRVSNSYYRLWHKYIFPNRSAIQLGDDELVSQIVASVSDTEIHRFHLRKAFVWMNAVYKQKLWMSFRNTKGVVYAPKTIREGGFQYYFDAIARHKQRVIFVKVFKNPLENCTQTELEKLRYAVSLINEYEDSHVYIFAKRRFSDYAVAQAAKDETLNLVEVDRLKY